MGQLVYVRRVGHTVPRLAVVKDFDGYVYRLACIGKRDSMWYAAIDGCARPPGCQPLTGEIGVRPWVDAIRPLCCKCGERRAICLDTSAFMLWCHDCSPRDAPRLFSIDAKHAAGKMSLFVATPSGPARTIVVFRRWTIERVKDEIRNIMGVAPDQQRLLFAGKQLEDARTLADYDVEREMTLHLLGCLCGD